ncbi:MAG: allose kinase [Propioniciclava sp.]
MTEDLVVGVDIGGTHLRVGAVDASFRLHNFEVHSSRAALLGDTPAEILIERLTDYLRRHQLTPAAVVAGFPSTVDLDRRVVVSTANIPGLHRIPFAEMLEDELGLPAFLERDTNLLLTHDMRAAGISHLPVVAGCYPGTGFGSAFQIGGRLHRGKTGTAGELGHIPVKDLESVCGCGNRGCIETIASGKRLEHIATRHFGHTPLDDLFTKHGHERPLDDFLDSLSIPIASVINILDPDAIVIGGGVVGMAGFPRDTLMAHVRRHSRKPEPEASLDVRFAQPGQENGVIGAGIYGHLQLAPQESA